MYRQCRGVPAATELGSARPEADAEHATAIIKKGPSAWAAGE
jgi:hypothetical protein